MPVSLTDDELAIIMDFARPLAPLARSAFLNALSIELGRERQLGPGLVSRICRNLQAIFRSARLRFGQRWRRQVRLRSQFIIHDHSPGDAIISFIFWFLNDVVLRRSPSVLTSFERRNFLAVFLKHIFGPTEQGLLKLSLGLHLPKRDGALERPLWRSTVVGENESCAIMFLTDAWSLMSCSVLFEFGFFLI